MAKLSNSDSRRMYSWWWDSHISPKNSKWLQENLTEMDVNVKSMIKLLEEDADSFARRAEMYYKKRPELMKMVEEFYRAYRALAERYDHATGVIRHAHRTMSEAFPNQMPVMLGDESPASAVSGNDPRTPDMMSTPNGEFADELDTCTERKNLKQFNDPLGSVERVRRSLNFDESEEKKQSDSKPSKSNQESDSEEILALKEALAKLEAEKEAGLVQYEQSLNKLSQLETEISKSREDFKALTDHANQAENDVSVLKEKLIALEAEKESKLQEYLQSVDKLNERANIAETEIDKLSVEKDTALEQYMQSLDIISKLENALRLTKENATGFKERAEKAENQVETLKKTISELTEEREIIAQQHQQCLESILSLEQKLSSAEEQRLFLESSNQSLHSELKTLISKLGTQTQELTEKQKELGRLRGCVQEERLRFVEAEMAFQTLQHLHAQTQDKLRAMASELQSRVHLLNASETQNQSFQNEISNLIELKGKLEGEVEIRLDERNALQQEIYCLKEELNDLNEKHVLVLGQVREVGLSPESLGSSVKELMDENSRQSSEKEALLEKLEILEQLIVKNSILETLLLDLNTELEAVKGKMEALEKSCKSLSNDKSGLLDEKASLVSQLQETNKNLEILSKNNAVLENFLSNVHHQLQNLMAKSKILEDSCQLLVDEKAELMSEKDGLTSQLKNTEMRLENLEKLYSELEGRCVNLEKEKETTLWKVEELNMSLEVERRENASYIRTNEAKMCDLEDECQQKKRELDEVFDCAIANEVEIFVLHTTARDMKENNCSLLIKNQKLLKEFILSKKKISSLEQKNSEQQFEIKSLTDRAEKDRFYVNQLLDKLQTAKKSLHKSEEENLESSVELSIIVTWIRQLAVDAQNLEVVKNEIESDRGTLLTLTEGLNSKLMDMRREKLEISDNVRHLEGKNNALEEENYVLCSKMLALENLSLIFKIFADEKFMLFKEIGDDRNKLRDTSSALVVKLSSTEGKLEELKIENVELKERLQKTEDELSVEIENGKKLLNRMTLQLLEAEEKISQVEKQKLELNESVQNLKTEYDVEKRSLMDNIGHLEGANNALEEENYVLCSKLLALENLLLIFRIFADEKCTVLREIEDDRNKLHDMNAALMGKSEESKIEIENVNKMLNQMELQHLEAEEKISRLEKQKHELNKSVQNLKTDYDEVKMARVHQENHILKLSADNEHLRSENNFLHQASQTLEADMEKLQIKHDMTKIQEENLSFQLGKKVNEIDELEIQAALIFGQLQDSMVSRIIYEQKFHELNDVCVGYMYENEGLESQLAAYGPEIVSLKECISSLENHTNIRIKCQNPENEELQAARVANKDNNKPLVPSGATDLHNLTARLRAIVKAAAELKEVMVQENINLHSKLNNTTKQLESLQSDQNGGRYRRSSRRLTSEITEADNVLLTKDIVLDQISDSSSYYSLSKRQPVDPDAQMVKLWATSDLSSKKKNDLRRLKSIKKQKSKILTSDFSSVDKLEISKGSNESFGEGNDNKRKILERLDSDVQKLANLQITVQDLKRKLEVTEKGKRGKAVIECESLKVQLEEADVAVMKMFELNGRLVKSIDDRSFSDVRSEKSSFDLENDGSARRRRVSEQARRMSEKIGRLQLEVQKLQFVLMKMDDAKDGHSRMSESRRRVLLRDFLYGGGRNGGQRRKKTQFCACVQPSTVED